MSCCEEWTAEYSSSSLIFTRSDTCAVSVYARQSSACKAYTNDTSLEQKMIFKISVALSKPSQKSLFYLNLVTPHKMPHSK